MIFKLNAGSSVCVYSVWSFAARWYLFIELTNRHTSLPRKCFAKEGIAPPVELANAHPAFPDQRSGKNVGPIKMAYAHPALSLTRERGSREVRESEGLSKILGRLPDAFWDISAVDRPLDGTLGKDQTLDVESALRSSRRVLRGKKRHAGTNEDAVLPGTRKTGTPPGRVDDRMLEAVDIKLGASPVLEQVNETSLRLGVDRLLVGHHAFERATDYSGSGSVPGR